MTGRGGDSVSSFLHFFSGGHLDQRSVTVLAILVKDDKKNILVKLY